MATLGPSLGILELANRTKNGAVISVAKTLSKQNDFLADAVFIEGNGSTGHVVARRTGLPSGSKRRINDGVAKENAKTKQIVETYELLESLSEVDAHLIKISPDPVKFRRTEDEAFLEGMAQTFATDFVYGNVATDVDSMHGLAPRRTALSDANVIGTGGTGSDLTTIWIVKWGPTGVYFTYPPGTDIGISFADLGPQLVAGATANTKFLAMVSQFVLNVGLAVADERCLQRVANNESGGGANGVDEDDLINAIANLPGGAEGTAILMNKTAKAQYDILVKDKANVNYPMTDPFGRPVPNFQGTPIRIVEAITDTEDALT